MCPHLPGAAPLVGLGQTMHAQQRLRKSPFLGRGAVLRDAEQLLDNDFRETHGAASRTAPLSRVTHLT